MPQDTQTIRQIENREEETEKEDDDDSEDLPTDFEEWGEELTEELCKALTTCETFDFNPDFSESWTPEERNKAQRMSSWAKQAWTEAMKVFDPLTLEAMNRPRKKSKKSQ